MANVDGARGLQPITSPYGTIRANLYPITKAYGTSLFRGDPILQVTAGTVEIASTGTCLGAAIGFFDENYAPINYYVASTATQAYVLVADDPNQEFWAQEDSDGGSLAVGQLFGNLDLVAGTGSSVTGESRYELDSSTLNTTATLGFKVIRLHVVQGNAVGTNAKWVVQMNYSQRATGSLAVGLS